MHYTQEETFTISTNPIQIYEKTAANTFLGNTAKETHRGLMDRNHRCFTKQPLI